MSDELKPEVRIDPSEEITPEKKVILLNQWREKVEAEIAGYVTEKDKIMAAYKILKERYDKILATRIKKMKKYDAVINARKKVLTDIVKEIQIATNDTTGTVS